ncbi:MAG: TfoX/Sxy family protein [Acidimicrobiia bacterium]|nr:TfoX/Sxy family protein [Acidimicrobiia bacterium]MBT8217143.1 TfoX/Sxy family protein [Acidimicrobiia bacterium]NNF09142.1 TfoX/Sxy family protein [Acidimicrobiia bacterium]NNL70489.1 TfoX/Sxy family protein [Acidimicrobiia bacterium]
MGTKGERLTGDATESAERLADALASLGDVTTRKMFGGYGVSEGNVMFGLIDSAGTAHLRVDETTESQFEAAGSTKHVRMPYWSIPPAIQDDPEVLLEWAGRALEVARRAKN